MTVHRCPLRRPGFKFPVGALESFSLLYQLILILLRFIYFNFFLSFLLHIICSVTVYAPTPLATRQKLQRKHHFASSESFSTVDSYVL